MTDHCIAFASVAEIKLISPEMRIILSFQQQVQLQKKFIWFFLQNEDLLNADFFHYFRWNVN